MANIIRSRQHPLQFISIAQCHIGDLGQTALADALAEDNQVVWLDTGASDTASLPATKVLGTVPASPDTKLAFVEVVAHRRKEGKQALGQDVLQVIFDFLRVPVRRHVR